MYIYTVTCILYTTRLDYPAPPRLFDKLNESLTTSPPSPPLLIQSHPKTNPFQKCLKSRSCNARSKKKKKKSTKNPKTISGPRWMDLHVKFGTDWSSRITVRHTYTLTYSLQCTPVLQCKVKVYCYVK